MGKKLTLEEAQQRFEARAARLTANVPKSFRGAMLQVRNLSGLELNRMVYSQPKAGARAGTLKNSEKLEWVDDRTAELRNDASSEWKGARKYYGWWVAYGRKAADKGRKYFAWMVNPAQPRPQTINVWKQCIRMGLAVWAHKIRAVPGRNWRASANNRARQLGITAVALTNATRDAYEGKSSD
jgi:hypothetical protein